MSQDILYEAHGGVRLITIDRPSKMNSLDFEANDALVENPSLANDDPYDAGWMVIIKPEDWDSVKSDLTPGSDVTAKYEAKMDADGFAGCE